MKKILVPIDFSPTSLKALEYATEIAKRTNYPLYLLHVMEPFADSIRQPFPMQEKLLEETTKNRQKEIESIEKGLTDKYPGIKIETELAHGMIITTLLTKSEEKDAGMIIMGTSGAGGLKEIFMGSVTAGLISKSSIPVLAIPDEYCMEIPDAILLATNHFEEKKEILDPVTNLAALFSADVHVAVFINPADAGASDYLDNTRKLNHYIELLNKMYPSISFLGNLIEGDRFEEAIEEFDEKNSIDLIAMISYPKSFLERILRKSVTKKMAFHSRIPILVIPSI